jgi:hypothetical protein
MDRRVGEAFLCVAELRMGGKGAKPDDAGKGGFTGHQALNPEVATWSVSNGHCNLTRSDPY